jgi:hypothetical protein
MHLSEQEKRIILSIRKLEISSLQDYISSFIETIDQQNTFGIYVEDDFVINANENLKILKDPSEAIASILKFLALCRRLESRDLIQLINKPIEKQSIPKLMERKEIKKDNYSISINKNIVSLYRENGGFSISVNSELYSFIENNFLTQEEVQLKEERASRVRAERITLIIATASILFSTLTSIGIAWFNYKTYTTERTVVVKNLERMQYPVEVKLNSPLQVSILNKEATSLTIRSRGDTVPVRP